MTPCVCGVNYHPDCRAELSRCVTIGCAGKSSGGPRARVHRDVFCVRCEGLINNNGDMCFGCWSPLHRRCLAAGCICRPRPNQVARPSMLHWALLAVVMLGTSTLFGSVIGTFVQGERYMSTPGLELALSTGRRVGGLVGFGIGVVGLILTVWAGPEATPGPVSPFRGHSRP